MKISALSLLLCLLSFPLLAADAYLCISEHGAGIMYKKSTSTWEGMNFKAGQRFIVKNSSIEWGLYEHGKSDSIARCGKSFTKNGFLKCTSAYNIFTMSKENLRFRYLYDAGYIQSTQDTPAALVGKCSEL